VKLVTPEPRDYLVTGTSVGAGEEDSSERDNHEEESDTKQESEGDADEEFSSEKEEMPGREQTKAHFCQ